MGKRSSRAPLNQLIKVAIKRVCVMHKTDEADKDLVMNLIGSSYSPGSISNSIRKLKKEGQAETPTSKTLKLTKKGDKKVGPIKLPTNEETLADMKERVKGSKAKLLLDILYKDGLAHSKKELEAALGDLVAGSKANILRQLLKLREVEVFKDSGETMYRLKGFAFPQGRPKAV